MCVFSLPTSNTITLKVRKKRRNTKIIYYTVKINLMLKEHKNVRF